MRRASRPVPSRNPIWCPARASRPAEIWIPATGIRSRKQSWCFSWTRTGRSNSAMEFNNAYVVIYMEKDGVPQSVFFKCYLPRLSKVRKCLYTGFGWSETIFITCTNWRNHVHQLFYRKFNLKVYVSKITYFFLKFRSLYNQQYREII